MRKLIFFAVLLFPLFSKAQFYGGAQMEFGQNRVQYQPFTWIYLAYDKYQVYFYEGGREMANYVSVSAKRNMEQMEKLFDYPIEDKLLFVIYNKQSDFKQSNLGLSTDDQYNTGGVTRIIGSKIILYFEGDHQKLEQQIRSGIAEVLIGQMMYGGDLKDKIKNSALLILPDWFTKGLISYTSKGWNSDIDNYVKDGILLGKYNKFNHLTGEDAVYAGHSIWNYIADTYGEAVIPNILYMAKISRNVESAFLFVLGVTLEELSTGWLESYQNKFAEADTSKTLPVSPGIIKRPKKARVYNQMKVSPDGNSVVYATNELGQYKVWLYNVQTKKTRRILKSGYKIDRINDYSYPLLAWHPNGEMFSIIIEKKGRLFMTHYVLKTHEKIERPMHNFEKILDFSYDNTGRKFVMSAVQNGQSDIFVFTTASDAYQQITKDLYDDFHPRFVHNSKEIIFSSNRPNDTIRFERYGQTQALFPNKDIFLYDYVSKSPVLKRITNSPMVDEVYAGDYDSLHYSYLSDKNGIRNRYVAHIDSVISFVDTSAHYRYIIKTFPISNYARNIVEQDVEAASGKYSEIMYFNGKYHLFVNDLNRNLTQGQELKNTYFRDYQLIAALKQKESDKKLKDSLASHLDKPLPGQKIIEEQNINKEKDKSIDINNYSFEYENKTSKEKIEVQKPVETLTNDTLSKDKNKPDEFVLGSARNYYTNYALDYVVSQLDNSFLNASYQKFSGGGSPIYLNPGLNSLIKIGMSDLFEDYRIVAGIRVSGGLNSYEYLLSYEDRIKNLDRQIVLHRQSFLNVGTDPLNNIFTHELKYILKWPFSEVACVKASANIRNDKTDFMAIDVPNLEHSPLYETWGGGKLEYIFDNTIKRGLNLYNGVRLKAFAEYLRQIDKKETDFLVLGFDVRYYQKIHRDIIWANRVAASTSLGQQKLIYYMGGVDNWLSPKFDRSINVATDQHYAYQTIATSMRGFYQNARNGNSFALISSEIRFPVFKYFLNKPIKSDFINNFQVVGFADVGTAWTGKSPYAEENSLNKTYINKTPFIIALNNLKQPIIGGYGFGLRSRVWGYFVRLDWAWGVEDNMIMKRISYLSLSLDF